MPIETIEKIVILELLPPHLKECHFFSWFPPDTVLPDFYLDESHFRSVGYFDKFDAF
jgi:hypothetical protein